MRVLIVGGGTGGHLFPAVALAETLMKKSADNQVRFVTTQRALDLQLLAGRGFSFIPLKMEGIKGKGLAGKLSSS
ncbi:MAG: glycosyltransferase, partial [Thermodesulfobacteriota bacterium]